MLLAGLTAAILLAELLAPQFVSALLVPGLPPDEQALTTTLTRIMLLHPLILGLGTVATAIHLLFQHGTFSAHSSALTSTALLGCALGLPAATADLLLIQCFYALKDARTPLFLNLGMLALHIVVLALLVKAFTGPLAILGIVLTSAVTGTVEAALLGLLLFRRLRKKVPADQGAQRLAS